MESKTGRARQTECEEDCGRAAVTNGRCKSHHWSWYRKQETDDPDRQCLVGWCRRIHVARGRCHSHHANLTSRAKRKGQWPITAEYLARQDAIDRAATRPATITTPVVTSPAMGLLLPSGERYACPDCRARLVVQVAPDLKERVDWDHLTVIHDLCCPRVNQLVREDIRESDIDLPVGSGYLNHALDVHHLTS